MTTDRPDETHYPLSPLEEGAPPATPLDLPARRMEAEDDEDRVDVRRFAAAIVRHRWVILLVVCIGAAAGFLAARYLVQPEYVAQATIWIEGAGGGSRQQSGTVDASPMRSSSLLNESAWVDLLRSYVVLDPVVISERLYLHPRREEDRPLLAGLSLQDRFAPGEYEIEVDPGRGTYVLRTQQGFVVEQGARGDSVGAGTVGFAWQPDLSAFPARRAVRFRVAPPRDESVQLARKLKTTMDKTGNFLRLELRGGDPQRTASILNTLAEQHVEVAAELKRAKIDTLVAILRHQLEVAERGLKESEMTLEDFKIATVTLPSDRSTPVAPGIDMTQRPVFDRFFTMKVDLEQLRQEQDGLRRAISGEGVVVEALAAVGAVQQSPQLVRALGQLTDARAELRALRGRYTAEHRAVVRAEEAVRELEQGTIPEMVRALIRELEIREQELGRSVESASSELRAIPTRSIEEARLERQVAINTQLYTTLEQRYQEARLASASSIPDIRILDPAAVPRRPVQDQKVMVFLMAMLGSLGLGIGGAILRDRFDPRIRYPDEVTRRMGLAILGSVPGLPKKLAQSRELAHVQEAFRTIRLNLKHAYGAAGPVTLTVTSPGPGDGKSFIASNLAVSFADLGHRVVLVDGDIRRGTLHSLLDVDRKPGLTDFLSGQLKRDRLARRTRFERLDIIPSGTRIRHGPELLGSKAMRDLLFGLRTEYDIIIVDSPPLGAGADPFALGTMTGNLLLVLRSGTTNAALARSKLELVDRLPIRVVGAIMNDVPATREYGYDYDSYAYVPGYEAVDEDGELAPLTKQEKQLQIEGVEG